MNRYDLGIKLLEEGLISEKAFNHVAGIQEIDFSNYEQPIDLKDLHHRFKNQSLAYTNIILNSMQIVLPPVRRVIRSRKDLTIHEFTITDNTESARVMVWNAEVEFMYQFKSRDYVNLKGVTWKYNDYVGEFQLALGYNYKDNIEKIFF